MAAWAGEILKVDLSSGKIISEVLPKDLAERFLGGAGLGAHYLYELVPPGIKPESPENYVIFGAGPLNGTIMPCSGRLSVTLLSPVTGIFADSNAGGDFAPELKYAGYDLILITGKAKSPLYLWIDNGRAELRDASFLVGKDIWEADELLKKRHGDWRIKTALIGPPALKGVLFGCLIINRYRAGGKTGVGTALAQKNLLGVAVRGRKGVEISDPASFETAANKILASMKNSTGYAAYSKLGTLGVADVYQEGHRLPTKNRLEVKLPDEQYKEICSDVFVRQYKIRDIGCFNCPVHCSNWWEIKEGRYAGEMGEKPELVALEVFASLLGAHDMPTLLHFQNESNRQGIDMMECGNVLAMAFEAYDKGLITTADTDGIPLEWGNVNAIHDVFEKIAKFEGFGQILGLGVRRAAERIGRGIDKFAIHVKGYGMSLVEIRNAPHWGLAFATATRGGDHLKALPGIVGFDPEMLRDLFGDQDPNEIISLMETKGKGNLVAWFENYNAILDSLGLCKLGYKVGWLHPKDLATAITAATGVPFSYERMMECGERIVNVEKAFNTRLGLDRKDDTVPRRFLEEPAPGGPRKGEHLGDLLPAMLDEYYRVRGWDVKSGLPGKATLERLGLQEIASELEKSGKLRK